MKKISLISISLLFFFLSVFAQSTQYLSEFNRQQTTIVWQEKRINEKIYLYAMQEDERHEYIMNQSLQTEKWKIVNPLSQTDLTLELHGNTYWITGKFKGKPITKTVKSKGYIWYQNIAYNAGLSLKDKQEIKYECFRPDNMKLYTMIAKNQGIEKFKGTNAQKVTVSLTGFLSVFWSCSYYFDPTTLKFIGYKGVNGKPGTPETTIKKIK